MVEGREKALIALLEGTCVRARLLPDGRGKKKGRHLLTDGFALSRRDYKKKKERNTRCSHDDCANAGEEGKDTLFITIKA